MISVIVPSFNASGTIARSLRALERQETSVDFEVIVVDSGSDGTAEIVAREFPRVRLLRSAERRYAGAARNLGVAAARGEVLAFTDADCLAASDWIESVAKVHRGDDLVVGGVIGNGNPGSWIGWGYYFTEFNHWLPGAAGRRVDDVAGCCWSMKRSAWDDHGPFLEGTYCSDTAFHWRIAEKGLQPRLDPTLRVDHLNPEGWRELTRHEAFHGRSFAAVRASQRRFSRGRALRHALTAPLLPFVLFARAAHRALGRREHRSRFLRSSPAVFWGIAAWSWGELRGYLAHSLRPTARRHRDPAQRTR